MSRVAIVTGDFVETGGMDQANLGFARSLLRLGVLVDLVGCRFAEDLGVRGARLHRVPRPWGRHAMAAPLLDLAGRRVAQHVLAAGGRVVVNGGNCQVGDVNWVHYLHAAHEARAQAGPIVRLRKGGMRWIDLAAERRALSAARVVIANSEVTRRCLLGCLGLDPARVKTVYYGVDPARFAPPSPAARAAARSAMGLSNDVLVGVFVGALGDRRKGFDVLYAAWRRLPVDRSPTLLVVGTGAELPAWRARAVSDDVAERFLFLGFRRDIPAILAAADVMVAPTRYEAYGLAVHEALCSGVPAVVSRAAGVAERVSGPLVELLVDDPESEAELLARLVSWSDSCEDRRQQAETLSGTLRGYTWEDMTRDMLEAIGPS